VLYLVLGLVLAAFGLLITALATAHTLFAWVSVAVSVLAAGLLVFDWLRGRRRAAEAAAEAEPDPVLLGRDGLPFGDGEQPFADTVRDAPEAAAPAEPRLEPPPERPRRESARREARHEVPRETPREAPRDEPAEPERVEPAAVPADQLDGRPDEQPDSRLDDQLDDRLDDRPAEPPLTRRQQAKLQAEEPGEPGEEQTDATDLLVVSDLRFEVRVVDERPRYHLSQCSYLVDKPTLPLPVAEARQLGFTPCARCGPDATLAARHRATAR
jgi:hypothetical protein